MEKMMVRQRPKTRSTEAADYQKVPRPIAAMSKQFEDGFEIKPHHHSRDQFLYSVTGLMRVRTKTEAWIVPPDRAVYLPAGVEHSIGIRGTVNMSTLYIAPGANEDLPVSPTVLEVTPLLKELVLGLIDEPVIYDEAGRGGALAKLIFDEIGRSRRIPLVIPMPHDARLLRVCNAILADPSSRRTLDDWAREAGASVRTLARLFEQELSTGFTPWRQRVRFHNAIEAIIGGEPIERVAERNGYRSPSAFSAAFRNIMGQSPSSLRTDDVTARAG
jgi:AraC-like DNA-binding protein/mannose-6-phosphate isomerase-like protein (cupin superfamily)